MLCVPLEMTSLTDRQQALIDKCEWMDTNGAVHGKVNDVVWAENRREVSKWAKESGYTHQQITACIIWRAKLAAKQKAVAEAAKEKEIKAASRVMTGNRNVGPSFYDQVAAQQLIK